MATRVADVRTLQRPAGLDTGDDKALVLAFQAGEIDAYSDIYEKYRALVSQICYRILQDREEADEAVQETMLRVYRGLPTFNGRYQLQAWVARIATNVALDMVRARSRRPQRGPALQDIFDERQELGLHISEDISEAVERVLDQEEIRSTLSSIPANHREALMLREFEGRSHEEIGDALGVSPQQAKALIHRAKKSFRRAWTEGGERRGIAVLAPILLAPFKLPGILRKIYQPAHDVVASATATAQQAAVQVSATPSVVQTAMSVGEKVTAAALTVIVAGTVGVGAVAIRHNQKPAKPPAASSAPAVVAPPAAPVESPPVKAKPVTKPHHKPKHHAGPAHGEGTAPVPGDTTETPGDEIPSPGAEVPIPPPPPPAPDWALAFDSSLSFGDPQLGLVSSAGSGVAGRNPSFHQTVAGPTLGADGSEIGRTYLEYWGGAAGDQGNVSMWLIVDTEAGRYFYQATGSLVGTSVDEEGVTTYDFSAKYYLDSAPAAVADAPMLHDGIVDITVRYWSDGTSLYAAAVSLHEA